jgi:Protein of unknown function (DUF2459)
MSLPFRLLATTALIVSATRLWAPEASAAADGRSVRVYLLADPFHTGLVFDLRWLEKRGYIKPAEIGDHEFVAMSWGDEVAYVQERWLTPGQVFRALFTPSPSVMECIPFDWKVEEVCPHQRVYVGEIPESAGVALAGFLNMHAERGLDDRPVTIGPSSWGEGRLIRCPDDVTYDISRNCNHWTAEALAAAGLSIDARKVLTAGAVVRQANSAANGFRLIWDPARGRSGGKIREQGIPSDSPPPSDPGRSR